MRIILSCLLALCLACSTLLCCGCGEVPKGEGETETEAETYAAVLNGTDYTCLTQEQKKAFSGRVAECLMDLYGGKASYWFEASGVGLFDIDGDGTPEIVEFSPGGSFLNHVLYVYDLNTGERIADVNGFSLTAALDGDQITFLTSSARRVGDEHYRTFNEVSINKQEKTTTYVERFHEYELLNMHAEIEEAEYTVFDYYAPRTVHMGVDPDGIRGLDYDGYSDKDNRSHTATKEEYDKAIAEYYDRVKVIPGSELEFVYWRDVIPEGKNFSDDPDRFVQMMAEKLCELGQMIVVRCK